MPISLQDQVYFGTFWQILDRPGSTAALQLGNGFENARIERTSDGDFFAGIVEQRDSSGRVTDIILAFAGAHGIDAVEGTALSAGIVLAEPLRAAALYDSLLANPAYAGARIHVTGHSLGAGYTQYVLAHSLATYGVEATDARADFVGFGAPTWLPNIARATGVDPALLEGRFTDYTAANDPVLGNGRELNGFDRIGTTYYLPPFTGTDDPVSMATAIVASHHPTTYASALGLPAWLGAEQQEAAMQAVSAQFQTGNSIDPDYGAPGTLDMLIWGSEAADSLFGRDGADKIVGNAGADILSGGAGDDLFVFRDLSDSGPSAGTADRIADFQGGDRIDLSLIDGNSMLPFDQPLHYVGSRAFTAPGQVRSFVSGNITWVQVNDDFDATPEFAVRLDGRHVLDASDFVFASDDVVAALTLYLGPDVLQASLL